jgi:hypothetical protein
LVLHNSFELNNEACDLPNGDALLEEQELSMHSADGDTRGTACLDAENETMPSIARDEGSYGFTAECQLSGFISNQACCSYYFSCVWLIYY